jgi:thioesterase domain-containing protein
MGFVHVDISVRGFSEAEARTGLPYLLEEFQQRDWLLHPSAVWDGANNRLAIAIDYEGNDTKLCGQAALDEVRNCVVACLQSASDIHFEIDGAKFTPVA